jgi:protocatechuate 3,4-dioxygenase beta subunit
MFCRTFSLLFLALTVVAGQQPAATPPKTPARIEGRVLSAVTGEPVKRSTVMLMPMQPGGEVAPSSTLTDAEGRFAMANLPPGNYRLTAEKTGFVRSEYGAKGNSRGGTTLTLAPGQELKSLEFKLQPHGVVAGRVFDEDGEPLANVGVSVMIYRYMQGKRQLMPAGGGSTNDLGEYRIFGLAAGRYYLSAIVRTNTMMGTVDRSASSGQPDEGYAATYYPGTNDPSGATSINVLAGKVAGGIDLRLMRTRTVRVRGRVLNAPAVTFGRVMVMIGSRESGFMFDRNMSTTQRDGSFEIRGVTPGSYILTAQSFDGQERLAAKVPIEVGSGNVEGVEMTLVAGQEIAGTLQIEGDANVRGAGIQIFVEAKDPSPLGGGSMATPKDDGSFTIRNITPDTYYVRVMGGAVPVYIKAVYNGDEESKEGELRILPGVTPQIRVLVSTAAGQISGVVKNEAGNPAPGITAVLVPEGSRRRQQSYYRTAISDQYGAYKLPGIAPGTYTLYAWEGVEPGQWMDPDFLAVWDRKGVSITVSENSKESRDVTVLKVEETPAGQ